MISFNSGNSNNKMSNNSLSSFSTYQNNNSNNNQLQLDNTELNIIQVDASGKSASTLYNNNNIVIGTYVSNTNQSSFKTTSSKNMNTYDVCEYENPPSESPTYNTRAEPQSIAYHNNIPTKYIVEGTGGINNTKYDENTADLYSYRDLNMNVYQETGSLNEHEDINETKEYTNFSVKSIEENSAVGCSLNLNNLKFVSNVNSLKTLSNVAVHQAVDNKEQLIIYKPLSSIYDPKYSVDLSYLNKSHKAESIYSIGAGVTNATSLNSNGPYLHELAIASTASLITKYQDHQSSQQTLETTTRKSDEQQQQLQIKNQLPVYQLHQIKQPVVGQLAQGSQQQLVTNHMTKNYTKNKIVNVRKGDGGGGIRGGWLFCGMCSLCFKVMNCFSGCCLRPCCSVAALLIGFILLSLIVAVTILLGMFGFLPIPKEITRNICNASQIYNSPYDLNNNATRIGSFNELDNLKNLLNATNQTLNFANMSIKTSTLSLTTNKKMAIINIKNKIRSKMRMQNKFKNKTTKLVALQYDILLMPNLVNKNTLTLFTNTPPSSSSFPSNSQSIDMQINLIVRIYCNSSTNLVHFKTREFSTIDISFSKDSDISVKKWNYDTATSILEIETNGNCSSSRQYKLNLFISYKNYGKFSDKNSKNNENSNTINNNKANQQYYMTNFNEKFDIPFPILVENFFNQIPVLSGLSIFNVTLAKLKSLDLSMIFNMDIQDIKESDGLEFIYYRPTPFLPPKTIGFIYGNLKCKDNYNLGSLSINLKVCSSNSQDTYGDVFDIIADYVKSLIEFYRQYTRKAYVLKKIDVIILSTKTYMDIINDDLIMSQIGIVYIPNSFISNLASMDQLTKSESKMKIINTISKQLARHWFKQFLEQDCEKNLFKEDYSYNDLTYDTMNLIKNICDSSKTNDCLGVDPFDKSINLYLEFNEKCFLNKGFVNWIGYLAFQTVYPDLFELVHLEWSLVKDIDEINFLSNLDLNYIYQSYNFPRLAETNNFLRTKTELKSLMSIRSIYLMLGSEKFQGLINDWFNIIKMMETNNDVSTINYTSTTIEALIESRISNLKQKNQESSILNVLEQYLIQYNIIPLEYGSIKNVLRSWMVADNDIIVNFDRNYNKKEAKLLLEPTKTEKNLVNFYYPLKYVNGLIKGSSKDKNFDLNLRINQQELTNIIWLNETNNNLKNLPGADKWLIANYVNMFPYFRVNYDRDNWVMLTDQLLYDFKNFNLNDRVHIIDDVFYLINNQKLPVSFALNILEYIPEEESYLPWKFAIKHLREIFNNIEDDSPIYAKFRTYVIQLIKPTYHRLKWGESYADTLDEKLIRILVVDLLCSIDYEDCVENSVKQLTDSIKINVYNIPQYLSKSIYCTAIRYTGINEWFFLWKYYLQQTDNGVKDSILYSLSCSSQIWILNLLLRKLIYENSISINELPMAFDYISHNPVGKYVVWNHVSQNYQSFYNKIGNDPDLFFKILQVSTNQFKLKYEIKQVYDFIDEMGFKNLTLYYNANNKESIYSNIQNKINKYAKWKQSNVKDLNEWLNKRLRLKDEF